MLPVEIHEFKKKPKILEWVYTIPMQIFQRYVGNLTNGFGIRDKLIYRCHHYHLVSLTDEFPDDVLPEIVNVPGSVGDDDDFLWMHLLVCGHVNVRCVYGLMGLLVDGFIKAYEGYGGYKGYRVMS